MFKFRLLFFALISVSINGADCLNCNLVDHITGIESVTRRCSIVDENQEIYICHLSNSVIIASRFIGLWMDEYSCILKKNELDEVVLEESKNPKEDFESLKKIFDSWPK